MTDHRRFANAGLPVVAESAGLGHGTDILVRQASPLCHALWLLGLEVDLFVNAGASSAERERVR